MVDKARSVIVLCLGDKKFMDAVTEAASMLAKFESLYMTKSFGS